MTEKMREKDRCAVCGWPLAGIVEKGCVRGNCSMRPLPKSIYDPERANREYGKELFTTQAAAPSGAQLRNAVKDILSNCADRFVHPEKVHALDPQSVIDKQIENGLAILLAALPGQPSPAPESVKLVGNRPPTEDEIRRGLELQPMAEECLRRNKERKEPSEGLEQVARECAARVSLIRPSWLRDAEIKLWTPIFFAILARHFSGGKGAELKFQEHTQHVQQFLNDLWAFSIDPLHEGMAGLKVAEVCGLLLKAASDNRDAVYELEGLFRTACLWVWKGLDAPGQTLESTMAMMREEHKKAAALIGSAVESSDHSQKVVELSPLHSKDCCCVYCRPDLIGRGEPHVKNLIIPHGDISTKQGSAVEEPPLSADVAQVPNSLAASAGTGKEQSVCNRERAGLGELPSAESDGNLAEPAPARKEESAGPEESK